MRSILLATTALGTGVLAHLSDVAIIKPGARSDRDFLASKLPPART